MNRICIIGIYIGKLPKYFDLWLKSCAYNPKIDFLLFTDGDIKSVPPNVFHYKITLKDIKAKAEKVLGFNVSLERPYKICDYRPLYGLIFKKYLNGYEYWGHCDFDLIFGDLYKYFEEHHFYEYDKFLALGHLSLYKNDEKMNNCFRLSGAKNDYITVYSNNRNFIFDEIIGITQIVINNGFKFFSKRIFADISTRYFRYKLGIRYELDSKPYNYKYQIFYWENGKCFREYLLNDHFVKEEYIYIHFQKRPNFDVNFDVNSVDAFYITPFGFIPKHNAVNKNAINVYNPYKGNLYELYEEYKYSFGKLRERIGIKIKRLKGAYSKCYKMVSNNRNSI